MDKTRALELAIEFGKIAVNTSQGKFHPTEVTAGNVADYIETLAERFEKMGDIDHE